MQVARYGRELKNALVEASEAFHIACSESEMV
jgi:hypothetical protein